MWPFIINQWLCVVAWRAVFTGAYGLLVSGQRPVPAHAHEAAGHQEHRAAVVAMAKPCAA